MKTASSTISHGLACLLFFFFKDPAPTEISPLSLHAALPILATPPAALAQRGNGRAVFAHPDTATAHTSPATRPSHAPRENVIAVAAPNARHAATCSGRQIGRAHV